MTTPFNPSIPFVNPSSTTTPFNPGFTFAASGCAPVNIFDPNGTLIATVQSGGSYTTSGQTFTRTITWKAGSSYAISFVSVGTGVIRVDSSTNISSVVYTNRTTLAVLTPPYSVNINDVVTVSIVPTNSAIDSVLVLEGTFASVTVSITDPNLGFNGVEAYNVNEASKNLSIIDTTTDTEIARLALDASSTHTADAYRGINDSVYIFGFTAGLNTLTVQILDCATNTLGAMASYAAPNIGISPVCAAYSYLRDKFIVVGGGGSSCPVVIFDPVTSSVTVTNLADLISATSVQYMGFADKLEDSFFVCGGTAASNCYQYLSATEFETNMSILRGGAATVAFNTTNRYIYTSDTNGGLRGYSPSRVPEKTFASSGAIRRGGICFDPVNNKLFGTDVTSRGYGMYDVASGVLTPFAPAAVGAETGYRCCEYSHLTGKVYITSRAGNIVRSINTTTGAIINTITVGNQHTSAAGGFNQLCFRRVKL